MSNIPTHSADAIDILNTLSQPHNLAEDELER